MHTHPVRRALAFALALAVTGVAGCYVPKPVAHAALKISPEGGYTLAGQAVLAGDLTQAIEAAKPPNGELVVQLEFAPTTDAAAVRAAVAAVTAAHARVAFAGRMPGS
jgi:hypothetical protein